MREQQIARTIYAEVLSRQTETNTRIRHIQLAIGEISELKLDSLQTHWRELIKNTRAEQAELRIRLIRAEVQCMACFEKYHPEGGEIHCPYCGSYGAKILAGEECYLESVETTNE